MFMSNHHILYNYLYRNDIWLWDRIFFLRTIEHVPNHQPVHIHKSVIIWRTHLLTGYNSLLCISLVITHCYVWLRFRFQKIMCLILFQTTNQNDLQLMCFALLVCYHHLQHRRSCTVVQKSSSRSPGADSSWKPWIERVKSTDSKQLGEGFSIVFRKISNSTGNHSTSLNHTTGMAIYQL